MRSSPSIETRDLTKTFPGEVVAVSGLDLHVPRGAVYGLIGRNGAGKTTTLRLLMGLLTPSRGEARVLGVDLRTAQQEDRSRVSYVSQSQQLPRWMTFQELSRYMAHFYQRWDPARVADLARAWGIAPHRPIGKLSGGDQRKAAIILALAPHPEVLLLDEPAAGLDPIARRELIDELVGLLAEGDGCTVLYSSHILTDLERISEWVGILDRGRLRLNARLDELQTRMQRIQIIFPSEAAPPVSSIPGASHWTVAGPVVTAVTQFLDVEHLDTIRRWPGVRVQVFPMSLEEIFLHVIGEGEPDLTAGEPDTKLLLNE